MSKDNTPIDKLDYFAVRAPFRYEDVLRQWKWKWVEANKPIGEQWDKDSPILLDENECGYQFVNVWAEMSYTWAEAMLAERALIDACGKDEGAEDAD